MSKITIEHIRPRYIVFKDTKKVPQEKIQAEIDSAYDRGTLDGLTGIALNAGVRHLTCHLLLLDIGLNQEVKTDTESNKRFDSDPAAVELKHYNDIVSKHANTSSSSFIIRG